VLHPRQSVCRALQEASPPLVRQVVRCVLLGAMHLALDPKAVPYVLQGLLPVLWELHRRRHVYRAL